MPERWQRELKKLRRAGPRVDLWTRVEEGPQGSPAPIPGRQRLLAGGVAFAVFVAAGAFAWNVFRPTPAGVAATEADPLVIRLEHPRLPPSATLAHLPKATFSYQGFVQEVPAQGAEGWPMPPNAVFALPLHYFGLPVAVGAPILIEGDAESVTGTLAPLAGSPDQSGADLDFTVGAVTLSEPGSWVLRVWGTWSEGSVSFTVEVNVGGLPTQAVLAFDERDPAAPQLSFTVGGATFPVVLGTHSWTFDGGSGNADAMTPPPFTDADLVQVPSGTPLLVRDAPPTVSIMANQGLTLNFGPSFDLSRPGASFDLPQGRYLVVVDAQWDDAQAQFWLPIEIVDRQVPTYAVVTHQSHAPVPRSVSEACPKAVGELTVDATSAAPGDRLTLSGPIYHQMEDGSFFLSPTEDYQAWWGIALDDYSDVGVAPSTIANGDDIKTPLSGPRMLGDHRPNGVCGFDITLIVPHVAPGSYDVTVISADAEGYAAYGTVTIQVLPTA